MVCSHKFFCNQQPCYWMYLCLHSAVSKFSTGYTWFYWPYHKNGGKRIQIPSNENDFAGYTEMELYVPCKYETYKEEILQHLSEGEYAEMMVKARGYMSSDAVKSIKPNIFVAFLL